MNISEKTLERLCIDDIPRIISEEHPIKFCCYIDDWEIDRMAQDYKSKVDEIVKFLCDEDAIDVLYEDYEEYGGSLTDFVRRDYDEEWLGFMIIETAEYIYVDSIIRDSSSDMLSECFMVFQELACSEPCHKLNNTVLSDNTPDIQIANFLSFSPIS